MRVVAFGTGFFSTYHYDSWSRIPGVELAGICVHSNVARGEEFAGRYGAARVFTDSAAMLDETKPELVDVITTPESHLDLVGLAVARGIPVICQKPLAPSFAEAETMVRIGKERGTLIVAHENWRFRPWNREVGRLLRDGAIGEPYNVTFRMRPGDGQGPRAYLDRQRYFQQMPRFLIHETGIHTIDVLRFLMGRITGVFAYLRKLNPVIAGEDAGYVTFAFASGAAGIFDGNRLADFEAENTRLTMGELLVEGPGGALRVDGQGRIWRRSKGSPEVEHSYLWEQRGYAGDSVHALQTHVVDHLRDGTPVENTAMEYLEALRVEEAIYRSHETQRWIELAQ
jgi:predicted dehydrogenase